MSATDAADSRQAGQERLRALLWAATLVWVVGMVTVFPLGNPALDAVSIFTFDWLASLIVIGLLCIALARTPTLLRQFGRVEALMAVYLAVVLVSWLTTLPGKTVVDVKRDLNLLWGGLVMPYAAFLVARHAGFTRRQVGAAVAVIVIGIGAFMLAVGFVQGVVDWRFLVLEEYQAVHPTRVRGTFANAVPYAVVLALLLPLALVLHALQPAGWRRLLVLALLLGFIEALVLSQVRVVWVALPLALLYVAVARPQLRRSAALLALAVVAVVALGWMGVDLRWVASADGAVRQANGSVAFRIADAEPIYNRVAVYATALNMIAHRPLLGFGFGAHTFEQWRSVYLTSCCGVSEEWATMCVVPHNEILNVLVLMGLIGLLVYLVLLREIWRLLTAQPVPRDQTSSAALIVAVQAGFILLAIAFQFHDLMYLSSVQVLFLFLVGLAVPYRQS